MADELLTVEQMYAADSAAIADGVPGVVLMENAGRAVADAVSLRWGIRPVAVLCGPGNNGGDGFVAARILAGRGWPVTVHLLGARERLTGDAAHHAALWDGSVEPLAADATAGAGVVVDAVFGAGLARPVEGVPRAALQAVPADAGVVAVDVPSGVHGDSGLVLGFAPRADATVTFFRAKPAHHLMPARALIGDLVVADIGIPTAVLGGIRPSAWRNGPAIWDDARPVLRDDGHKFVRGHLTVLGGATLTGAARLAARSALNAGAGLVTVLAPERALPTYRADLASIMTAAADDPESVAEWFGDERRNAAVVGPGLGRGGEARATVAAVLAARRATVIDADGLSCFAGEPDALAAAIGGACVLTPHEGEFARLFGDGFEADGGRLARARAAAARMGAVMLLKGPDTVVAAPDGRAAINGNAPPTLAVAGSGDVLSGLIGAALAMGMPAFEAAALAAQLHGEAGRRMARANADALADAVRPLWSRLA